MRKEIQRMAIDVGFDRAYVSEEAALSLLIPLERFYNLAVQHEREECAKICDSVSSYGNPMTANDVADAIRARGEKQ